MSAPPEVGRAHRWGVGAGMLVAFVLSTLVIGWAALGGRWFVVESPSMGTAAPVGTLLWERPLGGREPEVGQVVTFRPPGSPQTYSHRVLRVAADGTFRTKGDLTPADPWQLHRDDVVGVVQMAWPGWGWAVTAAPVLLPGLGVLWLLLRFVPRARRLPLVLVGASVLTAVVLVVYQPLTRAEQLSLERVEGGAEATFVSTGLLPMRLVAGDGDWAAMRPGEVGHVSTTRPSTSDGYQFSLRPDLAWWFWLLMVLGCFVPALWTLAVGDPGLRRERRAGPRRTRSGTRGRTSSRTRRTRDGRSLRD